MNLLPWRADQSKLVRALQHHIASVPSAGSKPPNMVFFRDAVEHVCRLARILQQPRGHAVLLGVGGCGKRSIARLAAAICECEFVTFANSPTHKEFREALKTVFELAGVDGKKVGLYLTDAQTRPSESMEDVSSVLNSGEVPRLFSAEECGALFDRMQDSFGKHDVPGVQSAMYKAFSQRARDNIHVVLALSPASESFRAKCKQFPAIANCCTIDWYAPWPEAALTAVAAYVLTEAGKGPVEAPGDAAFSAIPQAAAAVHLAVDVQAARYKKETMQRVYTTPQSFLHLLRHFQHLEKAKRAELGAARTRVLAGLDKLHETKGTVTEMEQELQSLKPVLEEKAARSAELLQQVEGKQADAEKIRQLMAQEEAEVAAQAKQTEVRHFRGQPGCVRVAAV
jgi:dynein heavy chain, axonemal